MSMSYHHSKKLPDRAERARVFNTTANITIDRGVCKHFANTSVFIPCARIAQGVSLGNNIKFKHRKYKIMIVFI